ncbi:MAG: DUF4360 domain-containing protein [Bdellovibrionota bacterium]
MLVDKLIKTAVLSLVSLTSFLALADPNPGEVYINNIVYGGTGCPMGTVAGDISTDGKAFTLLFDEYAAEIGPGVPYQERRKHCQLTVNIHVPNGWSYTLFDVDFAGFVDLERDTKGTLKSVYYFEGQRSNDATFVVSGNGPLTSDYHVKNSLDIDNFVWSPCGVNRALNVKTSIDVQALRPGRSALATVDSIDGEFTHVYGIRWRRC